MIPEITTLPAAAPSLRPKTLLDKDGVTCTLLTLNPGQETAPLEPRENAGRLLIVIDGQVTVRLPGVSTMLDSEGALLLAADASHALAASPEGARILRVEWPQPRAAEPVIHSFDR